MPEFGQLSRDRVPYSTPFVAPLYPPPPWPLPDAQILQFVFEVDRDVALAWLTPGLAKPVPPYAQIIIARYPDSPIGPFAVAHQMLICRSLTRARGLVIQSVVDGPPAALAGLREIWGFPARPGRVQLDVSDIEVTGTVHDDQGRTLAVVHMTQLHPADPQHIHYDPILAPRMAPAVQDEKGPGLLELTQVDPDYEIKDCRLGAGAVTYPDTSEGYPWRLLQNRNTIATTFTVSDTALPWARYMVEF